MKTNETADDFLERNGKASYEAREFNIYNVDEGKHWIMRSNGS